MSMSESETQNSVTPTENTKVVIRRLDDGGWEVSQYEMPYPNNASGLSIAMYNQLDDLLKGHIGQMLGKLLTLIDSMGDSDYVNKARKDIVKEIVKTGQGNFLTDIVATCEDLDEWATWMNGNYTINKREDQGSSIDEFNHFRYIVL